MTSQQMDDLKVEGAAILLGLIALAILLPLTGCASKDDIDAYARQQCAPMEKHGAAEFDHCVVQATLDCDRQGAQHVPMACRPTR